MTGQDFGKVGIVRGVMNDLIRTVMALTTEDHQGERNWEPLFEIADELERLRKLQSDTIKSIQASSILMNIDEHVGVLVAHTNVFIKEVGLRLADDAPARFSMVVRTTPNKKREAHLYGAYDCQVDLRKLAKLFGGDGTYKYAVIPNLPLSWRWGQDLTSRSFQWQVKFEMT